MTAETPAPYDPVASLEEAQEDTRREQEEETRAYDEKIGRTHIWPEPLPVEVFTPSPRMDLEKCMPPVIRNAIEEVAVHGEVDANILAGAALAVLSAATFGVYEAHLPNGHVIGASLFVIAMAETGERKGNITHMSAPLTQLQDELQDSEYRRASFAEADIDLANRAYETEKKSKTPDRAKVQLLKEERDRLVRAYRPPLEVFVTDATPEALQDHMGEQQGFAAVLDEEAAFLKVAKGRHSDGEARLEFFNSSYDGRHYTVKRVSRKVRLPRTHLAIFTTPQPAVMREYADAFTEGSGWIPRMLLSVESPKSGHRNPRNMTKLGEGHKKYVEAVKNMARVSYAMFCEQRTTTPWRPREVVELSYDATEALLTYAVGAEKRKRIGQSLEHARGWAERLTARAVKIALGFALLRDPTTRRISLEDMRYAVAISEWSEKAALPALKILRASDSRPTALRVFRAIQSKVPPWVKYISTNEVLHLVMNKTDLATAAAVNAALRTLEERNYVRYRGKVSLTGTGRPKDIWEIAPSFPRDIDTAGVTHEFQ